MIKKIWLFSITILLLSFTSPSTVSALCGTLGQECCALPAGPSCNLGLICNPASNYCEAKSGPFAGCEGGNSINTAIGCVSVLEGENALLGDILQWGIGIGGGIAFLLITYASFMIMASSGNPERIKAGKELLGSAISGLLLLIFSVFILKFIGVDILGLNEFGFTQTP